MGGITHFIYHPWFEPVEYRELEAGTTGYGRTPSSQVSTQPPLDMYQRAEGDKIQVRGDAPLVRRKLDQGSDRGRGGPIALEHGQKAGGRGRTQHRHSTRCPCNVRTWEKAVYGGNRNLASHLRTPIETMYDDKLPQG